MEKDRLCFLNLYKFIGTILIACFLHYGQLFLPFLGLTFQHNGAVISFLLSGEGNLIVEFFYVMSGFISIYAYSEMIDNGTISFSDFISNRLRKLFPLVFTTT